MWCVGMVRRRCCSMRWCALMRLRQRRKNLQYRGRILFRGEEVPFAVSETEWERQPARWLRRYLLGQGKGVLQFAPGLRDLLEIALRFQEPALG
jgi:hypothetical protein